MLFASDFIINGSSILFKHVGQLYGMILHHAVFHHHFAFSTVIPIPKGGMKLISSSDITVASHSIVFLVSYLTRCCLAACSDLQNGFQKEHSTVQWTLDLNETINYYTSRGSIMHVMLLDANKAFD